MSPFYAAYLRQLLPNKPGYASGGTVQDGIVNKGTATPTAADTAMPNQMAPGAQLGGPTTSGPNSTTGAGNMANAHGQFMEDLSGGMAGKNGQWMDPGHKLGIGPNVAGMTNTILDALSNKFQAQAAPIQEGTNTAQLQQAYNQAQQGIVQQQGLVNQLGAQGGIQNQSNVYDQFGQIAQGIGPNPAQEMLRQQTGNNMAMQASSMASQRGASANPAALARSIAQQGAATQQNAVGQAAALQAQQSLNALGNQGNIAGQQVSNQMAGVQGLNNAVQNEQNILQGANTAFNNAQVNMVGGMNSANAQAAAGNQQAAGQVAGGLMKGVSAVASMFSDERGKKNFESADFDIDKFLDSLHRPNMAEGGEIASEDQPEVTAPQLETPVAVQAAPPQSSIGQWLSSNVDTGGGSTASTTAAFAPLKWDFSMGMGGGGGEGGGGVGSMMGGMAEGGEIEEAVEPKSYDYKDPNQPGAAEGRQFGITAQDLEKSEAGASVVEDTPQGKMIDSPHAIGLLLASVGRLNERIKALEGKGSKKKMAQGGQVDALVSPGEKYLTPQDLQKVKAGKHPLSVGSTIPGKPKVAGATDNYANDTVPKKLQVGGIVLPRSVTQAPDKAQKAEAFVEAIFMGKPKLKKRGK